MRVGAVSRCAPGRPARCSHLDSETDRRLINTKALSAASAQGFWLYKG